MANDKYSPSTTAVCFENFKEAALYFDRVLPLNMGRMQGDPDVGDILVGYPESVPSAALSHLVDGVEGNTITYSHATRVIELFGVKWVSLRGRPSHTPNSGSQTTVTVKTKTSRMNIGNCRRHT